MEHSKTTEASWDRLADAIRHALSQTHQAGYQQARYTHNAEPNDQLAKAQRDLSTANESLAVSQLWQAFYAAASDQAEQVEL